MEMVNIRKSKHVACRHRNQEQLLSLDSIDFAQFSGYCDAYNRIYAKHVDLVLSNKLILIKMFCKEGFLML